MVTADFSEEGFLVVLPFQVGGELPFFAGAEGLVDNSGFVVFGVPKVVAIDISVGEPEGAMMGVVGFFPGHVFLHREIAGQSGPGRADQRVEVGEVVISPVFGDEGFAVEELERGVGLLLAEFREGRLCENE